MLLAAHFLLFIFHFSFLTAYDLNFYVFNSSSFLFIFFQEREILFMIRIGKCIEIVTNKISTWM